MNVILTGKFMHASILDMFIEVVWVAWWHRYRTRSHVLVLTGANYLHSSWHAQANSAFHPSGVVKC